MEGGSVLGSPTASGRRRHKALEPCRFQSGDRFDVRCPGLEAPGDSADTAAGEATAGIGTEGPEGDSQDADRGLERSVTASDGRGEISIAAVAGGHCKSEGLTGDADADTKESNVFRYDFDLEDSLRSSGAVAEPNLAAKLSNLQSSPFNCTAEEGKTAANDSDPRNFRTHDRAVMDCRKGWKTVAPWRFQDKRPSSQGFCSGNGSDEEERLGATASKIGGGLSRRAPTKWHDCFRVRVSDNSSHAEVKVQSKNASVAKKRKTDKAKVKVQSTTVSVAKKRKLDKAKVKVQSRNASVANKMKIDNEDDGRVMPNYGVAATRERVTASLREFRIIYRKLLEEEETKWKQIRLGLRPDLAALRIFRERLSAYQEMSYMGNVPGVQIGDVFNSIMEICIVGLHRQPLMHVDCIRKEDGTSLAVSIVSYAQPSVFNNNLESLLHVGSMGATIDQTLEGTDLALKQSMDTDTPVRVIHEFAAALVENCQPKELSSYIYGGLYSVKKFVKQKVREDRYIHVFHLRKMAGQLHIDIQELAKTRMPEPFDGIFMADISQGLEKIPISVINSISNEHPMPFRYISQIQYPPKYQPDPPSGCDCVGGCSDSERCACAVKNGGSIPFDDNGTIVEVYGKPLVYECGPSCKCPPTCQNRVSQHGIKFRIQVFKTKSMGWGVRTLDFIPSGSFVCEYTGELLENEEAEKRKNDEYLFVIGNNYYDESRWENMPKTIPSLQNGPSKDEEDGFAIDALNWGSLARFINHSCTPNLLPQDVLYDHDNTRMPHVMFFAGDNHILPLDELSYDYNYTIGKVFDSDGNVKTKQCFCGSTDCIGRLY